MARVALPRSSPDAEPRRRRLPPLILVLACAKLAVLLPWATAYGYSRDELYLLACARRLAWGYADRPPLSLAILAAVRSAYGEAILSVRVVPAIAGAVVVGLTASLAKAFGGGVRAQGLAALAVLVAPTYLASSHVFSPDAIAPLFYVLGALFLARAVSAPSESGSAWWILLGVSLGLGVENTWSALVYAGGLGLGLALPPSRSAWKSRGPWISFGLVVLAVLPYALWERAHGWPTRDVLRATLQGRGVHPFAFSRDAFLGMLPVSLPLWGAGLWALCIDKRFEKWRALGVAFGVVLFVSIFEGHETADDLAPAFLPLFAAGAVFVDDWLGARVWGHAAYAAAVAIAGVVGVPFVVPVLPVYSFMRYAAKLGALPEGPAGRTPLPRRYADMFGWKNMTETVASVYAALPEEDQREAVLFADDAGEAGAIEAFGSELGLPTPISGDGEYWFWGTRGATGKVVVTVGGNPDAWRSRCDRLEVAAVFTHSLVTPEENHLRVSICHGTKEPLDTLWPELRRFD